MEAAAVATAAVVAVADGGTVAADATVEDAGTTDKHAFGTTGCAIEDYASSNEHLACTSGEPGAQSPHGERYACIYGCTETLVDGDS